MAVIEEIDKETADQSPVEENIGTSPAEADDGAKSVSPVEKADCAKKEDKVPAQPAAPPAPEMKISQILPMVAMFALQKYDLEEMGYRHHVEIAYVVIQLVSVFALYFVRQKITSMADDGKKIKIPEVKQFGQVVTPAKEQTPKEYDLEKLKEAVKQPLIGFFIVGGIYYKWGSLFPLIMQVLMTPLQLYESPLFQMHLMNKPQSRPFPAANPFGLPSAPEPAAEAVDDADEKKDK